MPNTSEKSDDSFEDGEGDRYGAPSHAVSYIRCKTEERKKKTTSRVEGAVDTGLPGIL